MNLLRAKQALMVICALVALAQIAEAAQTVMHEFPPGLVVPPDAALTPDFNVERATQAYLDLLSPAQRARSDAYFEGGYWLQLWGFLYSLGVSWLLLANRSSDRGRQSQERWFLTSSRCQRRKSSHRQNLRRQLPGSHRR
jgi:STE24 endopeptidase